MADNREQMELMESPMSLPSPPAAHPPKRAGPPTAETRTCSRKVSPLGQVTAMTG